jgi:DUF4097 and DUF4098 domain-containing protein YvlB
MKRMLLGLMALSWSLAFSQETIRRSFNVSPGQMLTLTLKTGGEIRITGWDRPVVSVDGLSKGRDGKNATVEFEQTNAGVQVTSRYIHQQDNKNASLEFDVSVPKRFDVAIDSMGGAIRISEIEGRLNGKTMGGELRLSNIKGNVDLSTMGGEINLTNSEVDGTLSTMGGNVVFEDVIGNVKGSSMGGNVVYRNVRRLVSSRSPGPPDSVGEEVNISTMGGEIRVDDAPLGANVSTMGGDVNVGRAARFVKVKTMGGDIRIQAIDGWVEAETMGGNVSVNMIGAENGTRRSANISSKGGEITLTVPTSLSVQFDLELAFTRNSKQNYTIASDFPLQIRDTPSWDYSRGSPRKFIYGTGMSGGGKHRIRIETINGNITIKRGG